MDTNMKGDIAEICIQADLVQAGYSVLVPQRKSARYDLVIELNGKFQRIQCKWGTFKNGAVMAHLQTFRRTSSGVLQTKYTADEVDFIAVYCQELRQSYLVPITDVLGLTGVTLRVDPTKNNQTTGLRMASQYLIKGP